MTLVVPDGHLWIVRDIDAYSNVGASSLTFFVAHATPGVLGAPPFMMGKISGGSEDLVQWRGRQVLPAGDEMILLPNGGSVDFNISGYDLLT